MSSLLPPPEADMRRAARLVRWYPASWRERYGAWCAVLAAVRGQPRLRRPVLLAALGAVVLVAGSHHFENGWPGTGAVPWAHQDMVPGGVAAFCWAATLSVSAYWAHPGALLSFP